MQVEFRRIDWPYRSTFRISNRVWTHAETVLVEVKDGILVGRGEAIGVFYHGETPDSLLTQLATVKPALIDGVSRTELQALLPPGGARNAIDCALWDLEAKRARLRAWELAEVKPINPLITAYTLSLDTPEAMAQSAGTVPRYSVLKLKLAGDGDLERVSAVRRVRPDARIIVDANQAWNERQLYQFVPKLAELGVALIEQPLAAAADQVLDGFDSAVPLCADESCQVTESLPSLIGKYQYVNIKLDKTGGLTEALRLARAAQTANLKLMVGCMGGSSLAMAPAFIVGQLCSVVDLDGPLLAAADVPGAIRYEGNQMCIPGPSLWG